MDNQHHEALALYGVPLGCAESAAVGTTSRCTLSSPDGFVEMIAANFDIGLVDPPAPPNHGAMRSCRRDKARCKHAHPVVDGARIDGDTAFGQPRHDIGVAEAIAQRVADSAGNDVIREPVAPERWRGVGRYAPTTVDAGDIAVIHPAVLLKSIIWEVVAYCPWRITPYHGRGTTRGFRPSVFVVFVCVRGLGYTFGYIPC